MIETLALLASGAAAGASATEVFRSRRLIDRLRAVALCSHELRGALTAIGAALSRLERPSGTSERSRVEALRHGYDRALSVARDLEVARGVPPARSAPHPELVDLEDVAGRVVDAWNVSLSVGARQVALDWRAGVTRRPRVSNATHAGARQSGCKCRRARTWPRDRHGAHEWQPVSVCVLDRGAGLMRPLLDVRPRSWQARRGHGLVVARHAVELHGGTLRPVRGPFGSGIEVRLPAGAGPAPVQASGTPAVPHRSGSGAATP